MFRILSGTLVLVLLLPHRNGELVVNVSSNPSGSSANPLDVFQQTVNGNSSTDTVIIDFVQHDGSVVTQLTDFRMQSQIVRVIIPGEEELNQPRFQVLCFVTSYTGDLIPPEAVMKLRQKHPGTVRLADDDMGDVIQDSPLSLMPSPIRMAAVSSHLTSFCKDARDTTFSSQHELYNILDASNGPKVNAISKTSVKDYDKLPRCFSVQGKNANAPCVCSLQVCFNWYPCALKYCRNKESEGEHRCGIKTCRKCMTYRYPTKSKSLCMWDEV